MHNGRVSLCWFLHNCWVHFYMGIFLQSGAYLLNGWVDDTPNKSYPGFHWLVPHVTEKSYLLIEELYIVSVTQFKLYGSLQPLLLVATKILNMYHSSVGTHIGNNKYVYTNIWKSAEKYRIKDFKSPRKKYPIFLGYWSKKIEEYFHLSNSNKVNIYQTMQQRIWKILLTLWWIM